MGFLDLFRSKYRHSDVRVRLEAVRAMTSDDAEILATVARTDKDASVRRVAIEKLDEVEVLAELAKKESDNGLRGLASERAAEIWVSSACQDEDEQLAETALQGLLELGDQKALAQVATRAAVKAVRQQAIDELTDPRGLAELAKATSSPEVRQAAVARIDDADTLRAIAVDTTVKELGLLAIDRIGARDTLELLAQKAKNKAVRQRARKKLDDIIEAEEARKPREADEVRRRRAEKTQLVREVEAVAEVFEWEKSLATVKKAETAWAPLVEILHPEDDALDDRFDKAVSRYYARREAAMSAAASGRMAAVPAERAERPERPERRERRERDDGDGDVINEAAMAAMRAQAGGPEDPKRAAREREAAERRKEREERDAARGDDVARREREIAERASSKQDTAERAAQIAQSLEALVDEMASLLDAPPDVRATDRLLEQARTAFAQLGRVAPDARAKLEARYDDVRGKLVVRANELRETEDWKRFANVPRAESLVAMAKELAELETPRIEVLKELQKQWKEVGPIPGKKSKELWEQFKAHTDAAYVRIKAGREAEGVKHAEAAKVKEALCAEAEALSESSDWDVTAQALKVLQQKWKDSGHVPRKQGDELWKRFRAACDKFFERRKPVLDEQLGELKQNAAAKEALIAKAEAVVAKAPGEAGWGKAIGAIKDLQAEWKEIGRVPRADVEPLWQRFRAACDGLFAKRDAARDAEADARRAEVDALRADIEAVLAGGEDVGGRALAVRKRIDELSEGGDAPGGDIGALYEKMLRFAIVEHGAELKGSDLDPVAMANKRAKLTAKVEAMVPKDAPAVSAAAAPEEIAAQLKNAMQKNALFKGDGRDPYEVVEELRAEWAAVGPVVGDDAEAAAKRFEELCVQVAGPARAREERSERGGRGERGERGDRGDRGDRGPRRERRERRERRADGAPVPTAKPDTVTSRVPVVAAPEDVTTRVEIEPPAVAAVPEIVDEPAPRPSRASTVVESPPPAPPHMLIADEPPLPEAAPAPVQAKPEPTPIEPAVAEPVKATKTEPVVVAPPPVPAPVPVAVAPTRTEPVSVAPPPAAPAPAPVAAAVPEPVVSTKTEPVVVAPPPPPAPPPAVTVAPAPAAAPAPASTDVVDEGWD